jgi:uncharacterized protein (DUF1501 family)
MTISRRFFLRAGGLTLASFGLEPLFLARAAYAAVRPHPVRQAGRKALVCLFQRGAVDGLSMIVPHGDVAYYRERPRIAIPGEQVIDLDGHFGLHPALAALKPYWDNRSLAPVHAVGSPDSTRSHFDAQDYMESGTPGIKATPDGWLNRYCQHREEHQATAFRAVAFGPELPRILEGSAPALAIPNLQTFGIRGARPAGRDRLTRAFEAMYGGDETGLLASSAAEGFEAARVLGRLNPDAYRPEYGASYPGGPLGRALAQIAALLKAEVGVEIAFADVGGWDTHVNQGATAGQLGNRLTEFAAALAAFATDLGDRMQDVVVLTMSEFGRTIRENGSGGTDHGHATAMFLLGGPVRGGRILGRWPGLDEGDRYDGRDLAVTTDFRALFSEVVARHLGFGDVAAVFPGFTGTPADFPGALAG